MRRDHSIIWNRSGRQFYKSLTMPQLPEHPGHFAEIVRAGDRFRHQRCAPLVRSLSQTPV